MVRFAVATYVALVLGAALAVDVHYHTAHCSGRCGQLLGIVGATFAASIVMAGAAGGVAAWCAYRLVSRRRRVRPHVVAHGLWQSVWRLHDEKRHGPIAALSLALAGTAGFVAAAFVHGQAPALLVVAACCGAAALGLSRHTQTRLGAADSARGTGSPGAYVCHRADTLGTFALVAPVAVGIVFAFLATSAA